MPSSSSTNAQKILCQQAEITQLRSDCDQWARGMARAEIEVERLREENALLTKGWQPATPTALLAEIEQLRESVKFLNSFRPDAELAKRDAEIERLREEHKGYIETVSLALQNTIAEIERLRDLEKVKLNVIKQMRLEIDVITTENKQRGVEIDQLRGLLRDARDDVADCMAREVKPRRIEAYKAQLAAIDGALGE